MFRARTFVAIQSNSLLLSTANGYKVLASTRADFHYTHTLWLSLDSSYLLFMCFLFVCCSFSALSLSSFWCVVETSLVFVRFGLFAAAFDPFRNYSFVVYLFETLSIHCNAFKMQSRYTRTFDSFGVSYGGAIGSTTYK